jgi:hypothetical protein
MKKILLIIVFAVSFCAANAQKNPGVVQFGAGINLGLPVGNFADISSVGIGVEVQGEYPFSNTASGIASVGYTNFFGKTVDIPGYGSVKYDNVGLIPILLGVRVYPSPLFFIGGKIGYGVFTGGGSSGGFDYNPQIGYNGPTVQVALGYNGVAVSGGSLGHIGLSAVYKFGTHR